MTAVQWHFEEAHYQQPDKMKRVYTILSFSGCFLLSRYFEFIFCFISKKKKRFLMIRLRDELDNTDLLHVRVSC